MNWRTSTPAWVRPIRHNRRWRKSGVGKVSTTKREKDQVEKHISPWRTSTPAWVR